MNLIQARLQLTSYSFLLVFFISLFVVIIEPAPSDLAFVVSFLALLLSGRIFVSRYLKFFFYLVAAYLFANLVSSFAWKSATFGGRYVAITIYMLLIPLLMAHFTDALGEDAVEKFYKFFFIAAGVSGFIGMLAVFRVAPGPITLYFRADDGLRLSPLFKDPNVYGPFMGSAGLLMLGNALRPDVGRQALRLIFSFFLLGMMFLTFSRGAWLGTGVSIFVMSTLILLFARRRKTLATFIALSTVGSAAAISAGVYMLEKLNLVDFLFKRFQLQSYDSHRFQNWANALQVVERKPLGVGPGHYVGRTHFPDSDFGLATHNIYLKVAVENGWFGFATFFSAICVLIYLLSRSIKAQDDRQPIRIAVLAAIVGQFASSVVVDSLHWRHLFVLFGFACCEIIVFQKQKHIKRLSLSYPPMPAFQRSNNLSTS